MAFWPNHLTVIAALLAAVAVPCGSAAWLVLRARSYSRLQAASASVRAGFAAVLVGLALLPFVVRAWAA